VFDGRDKRGATERNSDRTKEKKRGVKFLLASHLGSTEQRIEARKAGFARAGRKNPVERSFQKGDARDAASFWNDIWIVDVIIFF